MFQYLAVGVAAHCEDTVRFLALRREVGDGEVLQRGEGEPLESR